MDDLLRWPLPDLLLLSIHSISHHNTGMILSAVRLFVALHDIDHVLGRPVVSADLRATVTSAYLVGLQQPAADVYLQTIVGLGVEGRPAEISRWDESRVDHHCNLKQQKRGASGDSHDAVLILTQCIRLKGLANCTRKIKEGWPIVSSPSQDQRTRSDGQLKSRLPKVPPETPRTAPHHQKIKNVMPGWLKLAALAIAIAGFILAMVLFH